MKSAAFIISLSLLSSFAFSQTISNAPISGKLIVNMTEDRVIPGSVHHVFATVGKRLSKGTQWEGLAYKTYVPKTYSRLEDVSTQVQPYADGTIGVQISVVDANCGAGIMKFVGKKQFSENHFELYPLSDDGSVGSERIAGLDVSAASPEIKMYKPVVIHTVGKIGCEMNIDAQSAINVGSSNSAGVRPSIAPESVSNEGSR